MEHMMTEFKELKSQTTGEPKSVPVKKCKSWGAAAYSSLVKVLEYSSIDEYAKNDRVNKTPKETWEKEKDTNIHPRNWRTK